MLRKMLLKDAVSWWKFKSGRFRTIFSGMGVIRNYVEILVKLWCDQNDVRIRTYSVPYFPAFGLNT